MQNSLKNIDIKNKTILMRVDLNVPMKAGKVTDDVRIRRILPTIKYIVENEAKLVLLSHFGRPNGKYEPSMSLAPLVDYAQEIFPDKEIHFGVDCVGNTAKEAVKNIQFGEIILLENLRFHWQEEAGDDEFAKEIASLGDIYVNEAFSCSHRAHASISGLPKFLPTYVGFAMQKELQTLEGILTSPDRPIGAIIGGSKVSTKLALLENMVEKVDYLMIGGAMANTFLAAKNVDVKLSLFEYEMVDIAVSILNNATNCEIILPKDVVIAKKLDYKIPCKIVDVNHIPADYMILDIGINSLNYMFNIINKCKTIIWNGPLGAFETSPFDGATVQLARMVAARTANNGLKSVGGGGDTVAAISHAGLADEFTYLSTAGGAFLEWLEGKKLPGIVALNQAA